MRTNKAAINSAMAIIQKIVDTILAFVYRTIFIYIMGVTYLGVNGLFSNIFAVMSLAELGVGSAIIYLLYEPLSNHDNEKVKSLMKVFAKTYNFIGIAILTIGIILIPFLPYLINSEGVEIPGLNWIYVLMLMNTAFGYFFSYKRSLLEADQKGYYSSINISIFSIINNVAKILMLLITRNFILTLVVSLIVTLVSNIVISIQTDKMYPYLKDKNVLKLSKDQGQTIIKRIKAVFMHNVSNVVLTGTDNIIISKFINISMVGIYSNYTLITNTLYGIFTMIFVSITSSVGNMHVTDTKEKSESIFFRLMLANFYFYFVSCVVLWSCITPFMQLWLGESFVLSGTVTAIIILNLYISGMRHVPVTFVNASGLNYNTRYKSVVEAIINLAISLIAVKYLGILGVILGTVIALITCSVWVEPFVLFKHWFKKSSKNYFLRYIGYLILTVVFSIMSNLICNFISIGGLGGLFIKAIISFGLANIIFIVIFGRTSDFKFYIDYFKNALKKLKNRFVK